jgi:hypothetical protein
MAMAYATTCVVKLIWWDVSCPPDCIPLTNPPAIDIDERPDSDSNDNSVVLLICYGRYIS